MSSSQYRLHKCICKCDSFTCTEHTEYICETCPSEKCALCFHCKESHVNDLKTIDHKIVTYRSKYEYTPKQENCARHFGSVYEMYCTSCELPVCIKCTEHENHMLVDIQKHYQTKRQQYEENIDSIRREILYSERFLLSDIKDDIKRCQTTFSLYRSNMLIKAQRVKDYMLSGSGFPFKHRCLGQKKKIINHLADKQTYEYNVEQSSPVKFLSSVKELCPLFKPCSPHLAYCSQLYVTKCLIDKDVIDFLSLVQKRVIRKVENEILLKLMPDETMTVTCVLNCRHISFLTSDQFWISDRKCNLSLTNKKGDILCELTDVCCGVGFHTVNDENELLYIDTRNNIKKVSTDLKAPTIFVQTSDRTWVLLCVYWSSLTEELLVGMRGQLKDTFKVTRYNQDGQLKNTIQFNDTEQKMCKYPRFLTVNNNLDVVVSGPGAVLVTDHGGNHRFSYTGHPSASAFLPQGLCTDALSHILVCETKTHTVQLIDVDGKFLFHLLIRPSGIFYPYNLRYDAKTHRLWVMLFNKIYVYRYLTQKDILADQTSDNTNGTNAHDQIQVSSTVKPQEEKGSRNVFKPPKLHHTFSVDGAVRCIHISFVKPENAWISDDKGNIIFTNLKGDNLLNVKRKSRNHGIHTVNSDNELIYIDYENNIKKLLKDKKATMIFLANNSTLRLLCVYWSETTDSLLVGMGHNPLRYQQRESNMQDIQGLKIYKKSDGLACNKVTRYNKIGEEIQTIQYNKTGQEMYRQPLYITENNNRDVVVSDNKEAVVVTDRRGNYRFTYTGHPPGSELSARGVCTDSLSNILIVDTKTKTVHMINQHGQFLGYLLKESKEIESVSCLCYDVTASRLWTGSWTNNKVTVYRHIDQPDALTDEAQSCLDEDTLASCSRTNPTF